MKSPAKQVVPIEQLIRSFPLSIGDYQVAFRIFTFYCIYSVESNILRIETTYAKLHIKKYLFCNKAVLYKTCHPLCIPQHFFEVAQNSQDLQTQDDPYVFLFHLWNENNLRKLIYPNR